MASPQRRKTAEIKISKEMLRKAKSMKPGSMLRIYSFLFENDRLFTTSSPSSTTMTGALKRQNKTRVFNSRILSAAFGGLKLMNLTSAEEMKGLFMPLSKKPGRIHCVFWDTHVQGRDNFLSQNFVWRNFDSIRQTGLPAQVYRQERWNN